MIAHVDMDAFYVSVERKDDPSLVGAPVIVASDSGRSVVLSASYDVRGLGVHSAQPVMQAKRLAPHARLVPPRHRRYVELSEQIMELLQQITPTVEQVSVDEAYLDIGGALRTWGTPEDVAAGIRRRIRQELDLPASVGLAPNKFLAKMASERAKPDGVFSLPPGRVAPFMERLPVSELFGVGEATALRLRQAGYSTAGELSRADPEQIRRSLGRGAARLVQLAAGVDEREVVTEREEKSLGAEHTYAEDVTDRELLDRTVLWLAHRVAGRARSHGRVGEVVALKVRWDDFTTLSRQRRLTRPTDAAAEIGAAARELIDALPTPLPPVRLVGVRLEGLAPHGAGRQLSLDGATDARRDAEEAMDRINERFAGAVGPASLIGGHDAGRRAEPRQGRDGRHPQTGSSPGESGAD